jgi:hypothetical protein
VHQSSVTGKFGSTPRQSGLHGNAAHTTACLQAAHRCALTQAEPHGLAVHRLLSLAVQLRLQQRYPRQQLGLPAGRRRRRRRGRRGVHAQPRYGLAEGLVQICPGPGGANASGSRQRGQAT